MSEIDEKKEIDPKWETKEGVKKIADFLRGRRGMTVRHAVELGKRVEYFKGDKLNSFLIESSSKSIHCPTITDKLDALKIGRLLIQYGYIHRSDRDSTNKKVLNPSRDHSFVSDGYYTWMYDGPKTLRNILTALIIIACLAFTCFPIWPYWAKIGIWYVSVTFLILMIGFSLVRLLTFLIFYVGGISFWILPNIYDDDLGVIESFKPTYSWEATSSSERYYRISVAVGFFAFIYWAYTQPTEFDEYVQITKQFTDDIYSGKLLDEVSQMHKDNIDKVKVPALEEFMKEDEEELKGTKVYEVETNDKDDRDTSEEEVEKILDKQLEEDLEGVE